MNNWFKWAVILIIFLGLLWFRWTCTHSGKSNTIVRYDTAYVINRDTVRVPYETLVPFRVQYRDTTVLHDTLEKFEIISNLEKVDTARILEQYFATRFYSESSKVQYGNVTINDTVTQNRIIGRSIILSQNIPVVKETITKNRVVLYWGIQAMGNKEFLPYAAGVTLDLKLKNGAMIGGGAYLTRSNYMYSAGLKWPIRLRKP